MLAAGVSLAFAVALAGCDGNASRPTGGGAPLEQKPPSAAEKHAAPGPLELADWTERSGIQFVHTDGSSGKHFIMETVSCGLALFDYDGDGLTDIYFCNGAPLSGQDVDRPPRHALYRNLGAWQFQDVSLSAGIDCTAFGLGIAVADYNSDGYPDIYLSNSGPNVQYRNNGDGTFTDVTTAELRAANASEQEPAIWTWKVMETSICSSPTTCSFPRRRTAHCASMGRTVYPGPLDYPRETNTLLRNEGDESWTDVSQSSGIGSREGTGMGTVCGDFDGDGDTDIYVANDEMANFLFQNDGHGAFAETGVYSGAAFDGLGISRGSMGTDCGDFDNDGWLDLYVTAYQYEMATLYRNLGDGGFRDVTRVTGAGEGTLAHVTWGCGLVDLDNDGDRDLFVACGHLDDRDENTVYRAPNLVLKNLLVETGQARFADISTRCGDGPLVRASSRGAAFDDLDNDGDLDVVILNSRQAPTVLRNRLRENGSTDHWLQVELRGTRTNRDGVGRASASWPANYRSWTKCIAAAVTRVTGVHGSTSDSGLTHTSIASRCTGWGAASTCGKVWLPTSG